MRIVMHPWCATHRPTGKRAFESRAKYEQSRKCQQVLCSMRIVMHPWCAKHRPTSQQREAVRREQGTSQVRTCQQTLPSVTSVVVTEGSNVLPRF